MKRIWFLIFALSMGLNAGLLYVSLSHRGAQGGQAQRSEESRPSGGADTERRAEQPEDTASVIRSHLDRMTHDLRLDTRQRSAIAAIHEDLLPRILAERAEMDSLRREVSVAYARPAIDPNAFRALVEKVSMAQTRIDSLVTEAMLREAAVLTHDQRQRYVEESPWGHPLAPPRREPEARQTDRLSPPQDVPQENRQETPRETPREEPEARQDDRRPPPPGPPVEGPDARPDGPRPRPPGPPPNNPPKDGPPQKRP
jgi:Spy/CpxP family protein refolding chaperone